MCLYYNAKESRKFAAKLKKAEKMTFFKVYYTNVSKGDDGNFTVSLTPPYLKDKGNVKISRDGFIRSDRRRTQVSEKEKQEMGVDKGIHVYSDGLYANATARESYGRVVFKVEGYAEDFVGCDSSHNHCVFRKVKMLPEALTEAVLARQGFTAEGLAESIASRESEIAISEARILAAANAIQKFRKEIRELEEAKATPPKVALA